MRGWEAGADVRSASLQMMLSEVPAPFNAVTCSEEEVEVALAIRPRRARASAFRRRRGKSSMQSHDLWPRPLTLESCDASQKKESWAKLGVSPWEAPSQYQPHRVLPTWQHVPAPLCSSPPPCPAARCCGPATARKELPVREGT
eukprot:3903535-Rhodomonas_salina.1